MRQTNGRTMRPMSIHILKSQIREAYAVYKSVDILGLEGSRLQYDVFSLFSLSYCRCCFLGSSFRSKNKPFMLAVRPSICRSSGYVQTNWNRLHSCETYDKCHFDYNNRFYWTTQFEWKWSNYVYIGIGISTPLTHQFWFAFVHISYAICCKSVCCCSMHTNLASGLT